MQTKADLFDAELSQLATQAKALSHPARLKILQVLAAREECICGELVEDLPLAQASVSRHLKTLKEAGLIKGEIDGPRTCYCLDREVLRVLQERFGAFFEGLSLTARIDDCC